MRNDSASTQPWQQVDGSQAYQYQPTPPVIGWTWQSETVSKLAIFTVGAVLALLVWKAGASWLVVAAIVGIVLTILIVATHPPLIAGLIQLRRDTLTAQIRLREVNARYLVERASEERQRAVALAQSEHYHLLQDAHDRQIAVVAGEARESLPVTDPLDDYMWHILFEAYSRAESDGRVPEGIISRRRTTEAGFTETQHAALTERLVSATVARFDRRRWFLNLDRVPSPERAFEALTGRRWAGK
jgi:hypothetical protein